VSFKLALSLRQQARALHNGSFVGWTGDTVRESEDLVDEVLPKISDSMRHRAEG